MNTFLKLFSLNLSLLLIVSFIGFPLIGQNETTKSEFISFYRYIPEKMTWNEHKKLAAIMGGDLACITNAFENEQVRRIAGGEVVWVGGTRKDCGNGPGSDYWKWSNEKKWSYTNWRAGEPNNYTKHDENRVMLWENGEWNDASLFHEFPAVYEIPSNSLVTYDMQSTSSLTKSLIVSGAGSPEVNGHYVYVENKHENRIFATDFGHYQHTSNPAIFIGFQNCGRLHNKPEWNKWVIFTEKGARYAAHTNRQINVPPRLGEWETVDHWPSGVEEAGKYPAPNLSYYEEEYKTTPANHSSILSIERIEILEAVNGKPVRFKLNNLPISNDAWVGIYAPGASDQDHGEQNKRWNWLREIDVNNASFPKQSEGDWSIRVFSDGGYNLHERKDFAVKPKLEIFSSDHNTNQYSQKEILDPTQTIQNKINNEPLSYYKFIPEKMTWAEHNNRAIEMGGNLASISNAIENNKVKEVSNGVNVWLGGVRKGCGNDTGADHWYWSNGKKWSYTNWMKNQPDNYHITHDKSEKSENRIHMTPISHGQQWNDISEDHQFSAVYELPIMDDSVDFFENKEIENSDFTKMNKNPIKKILGSLINIGSIFQIQRVNSNQINN